eukprot:1714331-Amphidinium_carterae.2
MSAERVWDVPCAALMWMGFVASISPKLTVCSDDGLLWVEHCHPNSESLPQAANEALASESLTERGGTLRLVPVCFPCLSCQARHLGHWEPNQMDFREGWFNIYRH